MTPPSEPGGKGSRASDKEKATAERNERVDHVIALMTSGAWAGSKSAYELSKHWGVSMEVIQDYAREASTVIRKVVMGDPDEIKAQILAGIEAIQQIALQRKRTWVSKDGDAVETPDPDCRSALHAYELRAKMLQLMPAERRELSGPNGGPIETKGGEVSVDELVTRIAGLAAGQGTKGED